MRRAVLVVIPLLGLMLGGALCGDAARGKNPQELLQEQACVADLDAPAGGVSAAAWSTAGTAVALASPDGTLRIYRTGPGADGSMAAFFMADTRLTAAAFAPEASLGGPPSLAAGCDDGIVHVISLDAVDWMA